MIYLPYFYVPDCDDERERERERAQQQQQMKKIEKRKERYYL